MKKTAVTVVLRNGLCAAIFFLCATFSFAQILPVPTIAAKSWILLDVSSNTVLGESKSEERIEPASLAKIMTAYLVFEALQTKKISMEQKVPISIDAWRVDPASSKMFIEPNTLVSIKDLLHGLIVSSGNDAAIALAENIAGTQEAFVALMNEQAARLGLKNTRFGNPHGLPDKNTYSTARDLATLAQRYVQDYPEYASIDTVKKFTYNKITQANRNRLLWLDDTVDGIKTGHTSRAGYSIIGAAKRPVSPNDATSRRLIAVVIGTNSDQTRTREALKLLNWGYQNFDLVKIYSKQQTVATPPVWKGAKNAIKIGFTEDIFVSVQKGAADKIKPVLERTDPLLAPLARHETVGSMKIMLDEKLLLQVPVLALEPVASASFLKRGWDALRLFVQEKTGL